jgi:hypothetical protein
MTHGQYVIERSWKTKVLLCVRCPRTESEPGAVLVLALLCLMPRVSCNGYDLKVEGLPGVGV